MQNSQRSLLWQCLILATVLGITVILLHNSGSLERLDQLIYDSMHRVHQRSANDEIVIVTIDEKSLAALGRWPWSRRVHADLIDQLSRSGAGAVGFDILLAEHDRGDPEGDAMLAAAIANHGGVILVTGPESSDASALVSEVLPLPAFAVAAAGIAHVDLEIDGDGICRKVFLRAGMGTPYWPAFGVAVVNQVYPEQAGLSMLPSVNETGTGSGWVRDQPILIPFSGPPGHFTQVSYIDVLEGRLAPDLLRDRLVFVGATAIGLGDFVSTPVSTMHTLMSGVEVNANVAAAILDGKLIQEAPPQLELMVNAVLILALAIWLVAFSGRLALFGYIVVTATALLIPLVMLFFRHVWISPVIAITCLTAWYVGWTWFDLSRQKRVSTILSTQVRQQALFDRLTGLPNRFRLDERLKELLKNGEETPAGLWVLIVSTGRPRSVIDTAGSMGKDALVKLITARLVDAIPDDYTVYRLEDTEFAILVESAETIHHMEQLASTLVESLVRPFQLRGGEFTIRPSVGASSFPRDGLRPRELVDNAHKAMHKAKKEQGRSFHFYSEDINADIYKRYIIEQGLRGYSWRNQFFCVYQPQISLDSGRITGVETLARWRHPVLGDIPPLDFIGVAEGENLIVPIGHWILQQACTQAQKWRERFGLELRVGVNVSALQLESADFLEAVAGALKQSGLPARNLELELTETALPADHDATVELLGRIKQLGIELAIDDFGTGYCSLTYLKSFPIDRIKIDQSFVMDMHRHGESSEITRSIVLMAKRLGLRVIAEGVERPEHLAQLRALGCDEAQGFLLGKPMHPDELEELLADPDLTPGPGPTLELERQ